MRALILAAGFGARLAPLTSVVPKVLIPVVNVPLIARVLTRLASDGVCEVAINTHVFGEQIQQFVGAGDNYSLGVNWLRESALTGTAGPVLKLREFFGDQPPLVVCGDVLGPRCCRALLDRHVESGASMTIAATRFPVDMGFPTLDTDPDGRIVRAGEPNREQRETLTPAGTWVADYALVESLAHRSAIFTADVLASAVASGKAYSLEITWAQDFGDLRTFCHDNFHVVARERAEACGSNESKVVHIDPTASVNPSATVDDDVVVGAYAAIEAGVEIKGPAIIGAECIVEAGAVITDAIVMPRTRVEARRVVTGLHADLGTLPEAIQQLAVRSYV